MATFPTDEHRDPVHCLRFRYLMPRQDYFRNRRIVIIPVGQDVSSFEITEGVETLRAVLYLSLLEHTDFFVADELSDLI